MNGYAKRGGLGGVAVIALLAVAVGVWIGADYYHLPARARLQHAQHASLRSSGTIGLLCGVAGTALFLLNLSYLLRKHLVSLQWLGTLRAWMGMHLVSGLVGAVLILFHSSFLPRSALGILALSGLGVVVVTGIAGRYLYALVPRGSDGHEMDAPELRTHLLALRQELEAAGIPEEELGGRKQLRLLKRRLRGRPGARRLLPIARAFSRDRRRLARLDDLRGLLGTWRFFHRWLAIVMLVLAVFHIAIALRFGDVRGIS
ncbi:MAG: hypothetical protein ACHQ1G_12250 [Planctomycetota bacterium]